MDKAKRNLIFTGFLIIFLYLFGYIIFRQTNIEVWEKDKNAYVIFPENKILYYVYRPVSLIDEKITGMKFHINKMELTELNTKYDEIKEKVTQLGRFL